MSQIDPQIIAKRKEYAPRLKVILDKTTEVINALDGVDSAATPVQGPKQDMLENIHKLKVELQTLKERASIRHHRFNSGLISVAVGGIEKSGKTTLLKTLTGIETLPTATERCTAVSCEIIYDTRNTFDLEFYDESGFCKNILYPLVDAFNKSFVESNNTQISRIQEPNSVSAFQALTLPSLGNFDAGTNPYIPLEALTNLQSHLMELKKFIGSAPQRGLLMSKLPHWVANSEDTVAQARVASVSRCIIYTPFQGGSENLRWIDTPGVDDPSPLARERTLRSIGKDADLLVVATMPRDKPSITNSFVAFWTSIRKIGDEVDLMQRLLVLLNWKREADPNKLEIEKHQIYLEQRHKVSPNLFCGPLEANKPDDVKQFMGDVNRHLASHLPGQDARVVEVLENELKSILAAIRTKVFDVANRLSPSDSAQANIEANLFDDWFETQGGKVGFWPHLRELFARAVGEVPRSPEVVKAQKDLELIFKEHTDKIKTNLPVEEAMQDKRMQSAGDPPINSFMKSFSSDQFSVLINALAKQVGEFGPIIQQAILQVLRQAGLGSLLPEGDPQEALRQLYTTLSREAPPDGNIILEPLEELAGLRQSFQYIYRWEMRPAINFLNPLHWSEGKAVDDLTKLLDQGGASSGKSSDIKKYFKENPIPGVEASDSKHAAVFGNICRFSLLGIKSVLDGGRCRLDSIADDFVRDFQTRLTFADYTSQAWRKVLRPCRGRLLGSKIDDIRSNSEKIRKFRSAVDQLGQILP